MYCISVIAASCLMVGIGPTLQGYVAQLVKSDDVNIYATAYQKAVTVFPSFKSWIWQTIDPAILIEGIVIGLAALSSPSPRTIFLRSSVTGFLTISSIDILLTLYHQSADQLSYIGECVLSNLIGAPVLGMTLVGFMSAAHAVMHFDGRSHGVSKTLATTTPLLLALLTTTGVYFIASTFYRVTPIEYRAMVSIPSNGVYRSDYRKGKGNDDHTRFSLFREIEVGNTLEWTGEASNLAIRWRAEAQSPKYSVAALLLDGCQPNDLSKLSLQSPASLLQSDVTQFDLSADSGLAQMSFPGTKNSHSYVRAAPDQIEQFTIQREDGQRTKRTVFLPSSGSFTHWRPLDPIAFYYSPFLIKGNGDYSTPSQRKFQLTIQELRYEVLVAPAKRPKGKGLIECRRIPIRLTEGKNKVQATSPIFGVLVSLTPQREHASYTAKSRDPLHISNAGGWLFHVAESDNGPGIEGSTDFMVARGNFTSARAADAPLHLQGEQILQAFGGESKVNLHENGQLELSGTVNALYWEQDRVNKTRWEKMETAEKALLISGMLSLLGVLAPLLFRTINSNRNIRLTL